MRTAERGHEVRAAHRGCPFREWDCVARRAASSRNAQAASIIWTVCFAAGVKRFPGPTLAAPDWTCRPARRGVWHGPGGGRPPGGPPVARLLKGRTLDYGCEGAMRGPMRLVVNRQV